MCLDLSKDWRRNRARARNHKGIIKAYKVLAIKMTGSESMPSAPFKGTLWTLGMNRSSREKLRISERVMPSEREIDDRQVHAGFHMFRRYKDAQKVVNRRNLRYSPHYAVYEVFIRPRDVVGVGMWDFQYPSIVAIRCRLGKRIYQ